MEYNNRPPERKMKMITSDNEYPIDSKQEHELALNMVNREGHLAFLVLRDGEVDYDVIKVMRVTDGKANDFWEIISVWMYDAWLDGEMPKVKSS